MNLYQSSFHIINNTQQGLSNTPIPVTRQNLQTLPTLDSEEYVLRALNHEDAPAWFAYLTIPAVLKNTHWNLSSHQDLHGLISSYQQSSADSSLRFAIAEKNNQANLSMIGSIGFHSISSIDQRAEITFDLHPNFWGKGIMTKACLVVAAWGFKECALQRIQASVLVDNKASINLLTRCGFELEGTLRNYKKVRGEWKDYFMYSKLATSI